MKKLSALALVAVAVSAASAAAADDTLARFKGGIGVHPLSNFTTVPVPNTVRGVPPAGQIWVIDKLEARVRANGQISVDGKGLILAGGNNAGRASGQSVFATLICDAAAPFNPLSTTLTGVPLAANGHFRINDVLSPAVPFSCASPMLLIRNAAGGGWFAVGIPVFDNDE